MTKFILLLLLISVNIFAQKQNKYPIAPKGEHSDKYFDTIIQDPYQWMENQKDERLADWLTKQRKINAKQERNQVNMRPLIRQLVSLQDNVESTVLKDSIRISKSNSYSKYQFKRVDNSYKETPDIAYRLGSKGRYKTLAKESDFKQDNEDVIHFGKPSISDKLNIAALPVQRNGSDWREIHFYNLVDNTKLADVLFYMCSSEIFWGSDGVYYSRFDKPKEEEELLSHFTGQRLCYHKFGDNFENDRVLFNNPNKKGTSIFTVWEIDDYNIGIHSYITSSDKIYRSVSFANISKPDSFQVKDILYLPNDDNIEISIEAIVNGKLIINTNWNAPNGRVLVADLSQLNNIEELIPEFDVNLIEVNKFGKDKLVCLYRQKGKYSALFVNIKGEILYKQDFDEGKVVNGLYENNDDAQYTKFCISSFYHPDLWYQISLKNFKISPITSLQVPYDPDELETHYVEYPSKDGTLVPMYITYSKKTKLNGKNPVKLYAYGGYGQIIEPNYNKFDALWILHGGILAVPNVRGGGAKGSSWAKAGRGVKKQNSIDDFNAAAEYLIENNYTRPENIVSEGGSHGGMLVAAAAIQRPDLYKAVVAKNGVMDMLRFEKYTVGGTNTNNSEFGLSSNLDEFESLCKYSPLHNVKGGVKYPDFLLVTGDKDHRVPPFHSYKFLATLQQKADPKSLYQMYLVKNAGHDLYTNNDEYIDYLLFKYYFMYKQVGLKY